MKFLNTIYGSWTKVFLSAILGAWLVELNSGRNLFTWDLKMLSDLLTVGLVSVIPIIINYLNPADTRYGK